MTVMEYAAKFIELARFADNYVATNMAKVRRFEDGLKLSIRGKIVGFLLHGFYGQDSYRHRERDRGRMEHQRYGC